MSAERNTISHEFGDEFWFWANDQGMSAAMKPAENEISATINFSKPDKGENGEITVLTRKHSSSSNEYKERPATLGEVAQFIALAATNVEKIEGNPNRKSDALDLVLAATDVLKKTILQTQI